MGDEKPRRVALWGEMSRVARKRATDELLEEQNREIAMKKQLASIEGVEEFLDAD